MGPLRKARRLWDTVRHLKPVQVYGRARFVLSRPSPDLAPPPPARALAAAPAEPAARERSLIGPSRLLLLGVERDIDDAGWDDPSIPKLWRYNLHYFDDLCAHGSGERIAWHRELIERWIRENPPAAGTGWEPYPTSLRIVNWVKWAWRGGKLSAAAEHSLAVQARWLRKRLEWHLLGNHLFVNAKALVFAGTYFEGPEADGWRRTGAAILARQIPEQILGDGGQFERSPMYHALALEDMVDLSVADAVASLGGLGAAIRLRVPAMAAWLKAMCHPDGEIAFFNDAAIGVHPSPAELEASMVRAGFPPVPGPADGITLLPQSGFVRLQVPGAVAIFDVGPVGPDYLPGHAHADTLSFELSVNGRRTVVNSGTSEYGSGAERLRQRGTSAHSTVSVDGADSSEVWAGFRVARRARPIGLEVREEGNVLLARCGHDGFRRIRPGLDHFRELRLRPGCLEVTDELTADGHMRAFLHWAPGAAPPAGPVRVECAGGAAVERPSTWHPAFGVIRSNVRTVIDADGRRLSVRLEW